MEFEWDDIKARLNLAKHQVAFEDAIPVFADASRIESFDGRDDYGEDRWLTVGLSGLILLAVVYTIREYEGKEVIRLISARRATKNERGSYHTAHS